MFRCAMPAMKPESEANAESCDARHFLNDFLQEKLLAVIAMVHRSMLIISKFNVSHAGTLYLQKA